MNQSIREAVELLFSACLDLNIEGRGQAFIEYLPHVDKVGVEVFPAGTFHDGSRIEHFRKEIYLSGPVASDAKGEIHALIEHLDDYRTEGAA